ncbi:MAG: glutamine--tRNA ligase/YqeY domain fusion protein [Alphaproteobacteria bacterium]|nr:glutamine--tRNA ligase/YqeY domain fusion protein [Alphaproteobacteria bacterium]
MSSEGTNFIRARIDADRAVGRHGGAVRTRFPPEPNGYLHIGHAKSICLNFGLARDYAGTCNLRFDDTNPTTEDPEFVDGILADVRWLGFEPDAVLYASDYFEQLYLWAEQLVRDGKAYVDDQDLEEIRATRGTVTEAGTPSPCRGRSPAENLDLLRRMRAGEFVDGAKVLRAKIDMAHPNMKMRDPLMYRIRHAHHYRTGDAWCIYPMYDWAHGQSDALERITHSICTLEFANNRELYDWFTEALGFEEPPKQLEFARLNLTYLVMSKRFFKRIVEEGRVDGWDDPRMPTIAGLRRRGVTPEAIRAFAEHVGVAKANSTVDLGLLEWFVRDDLNRKAPRRMAVLDPLEVELTGLPAPLALDAPEFPRDVRDLPGAPPEGVDWQAVRTVSMGSRLLIERSDFAAEPPPGFRRLVPGGLVRLRHGPVVRCDAVERDAAGEVTRLRCAVVDDPEARPRGVIHWVDAASAVRVKVKLYDRLFAVPSPGERTGELLDDLNPHSLVVADGWAEPSVAAAGPGSRLQLERHGYVYRAPQDEGADLVLTLVVGLKDVWAAKEEGVVLSDEPEEDEVDPAQVAAEQARIKADARTAHFLEHPDAESAFTALTTAGASDDAAWTIATDATLRSLAETASAHAPPGAVGTWIANVLVNELKMREASAEGVDGVALGRLVALVEDGTLSAALGKKVLAVILDEGGDPRAIAEARGWVQVSDAAALEAVVDAVLAAHPDEVARYRAGEAKLAGFLMGQVMKASKGKANPGVARGLLDAKLG